MYLQQAENFNVHRPHNYRPCHSLADHHNPRRRHPPVNFTNGPAHDPIINRPNHSLLPSPVDCHSRPIQPAKPTHTAELHFFPTAGLTPVVRAQIWRLMRREIVVRSRKKLEEGERNGD